MNAEEFREFGKAAVDYIADYVKNIKELPVLPEVKPGYLQELVPDSAPENGESWQDILKDVDRVIMPGLTHWNSPNFHAFYPTANSFPAIVGELMSAGFGCIGLSWIASPVCTELEVLTMNWLGKMLDLPEIFLNSSEGSGGGVIQGSASEATFITLLAAKEKKVKDLLNENTTLTESEIKGKLVAYSSDQSNSSVEKAGLLGSMKMRLLPTDKEGVLRSEVLQEAIRADKEQGLIPCFVVANLGTTPTCAFDKLEELGPICQKEKLWFHVDAAYAGTAFICPEYRYLNKGVEMADSFNFNPHKWMLVNFDCSALWLRDAKYLVEAFNVERIYLKDQHQGMAPEYRHWQIALGRRFRALKLWFVLRIYGVEGIQKHVRHQIALAKYFEGLVVQDERFELCSCSMGLVCFRLKGDDQLSKTLLEGVAKRKKIFCIAGHYNHKYCIRFAVCSRLTNWEDIEFAWGEFRAVADEMFQENVKNIKHVKGICESNPINITACEEKTK